MKKFFSFVLTLALVFGSFSTTFAFEDVPVNNSQLLNAIDNLNNLDIVEGYGDDTFKPEKVVTRAEMAKMLIAARGLETLADAEGNNSSFVDSQNHWAKGYISVASDLGIINGRGNGIFDPDASVTYNEAIAMVLRALGYTNESVNKGKAAYDAEAYKEKAFSLGLLTDILKYAASGDTADADLDMKAGANRGDIALMLNVSLEQDIVNSMGGTATAVGNTLLEEHAKTKVSLGKQPATKKAIEITSENIDSYSGVIDLSPYLFQSVAAYVNAENKVLYVSAHLNNTVKGVITDINQNSDANQYNAVSIDGTQYMMDMDGNYIMNGTGVEYSVIDTMHKGKLVGAEGTFILSDKGIIKAAVMEKATETIQITTPYIYGKLKFNGIDLPKTKKGTVDFDKLTIVGASSLEKIQSDDIVTFFQDYDGIVHKLIVSSEIVKGKITVITAYGDYYINGTVYKVLNQAVLDSLKENVKGTFYLDYQGKIAAFRPEVTTTVKKSSKPRSVDYTGSFIVDSVRQGESGESGSVAAAIEILAPSPTESQRDLREFYFSTGATFTLKSNDGETTTSGAVFNDSGNVTFSTTFGGIHGVNNGADVAGIVDIIMDTNASKSAIILEKYTLYGGKVKDLQMRELKEVITSSGALEVSNSAIDVPTYYLYQDQESSAWHFETTTKDLITDTADGEICKVIEVDNPDVPDTKKYTLIIIMREPEPSDPDTPD